MGNRWLSASDGGAPLAGEVPRGMALLWDASAQEGTRQGLLSCCFKLVLNERSLDGSICNIRPYTMNMTQISFIYM